LCAGDSGATEQSQNQRGTNGCSHHFSLFECSRTQGYSAQGERKFYRSKEARLRSDKRCAGRNLIAALGWPQVISQFKTPNRVQAWPDCAIF